MSKMSRLILTANNFGQDEHKDLHKVPVLSCEYLKWGAVWLEYVFKILSYPPIGEEDENFWHNHRSPLYNFKIPGRNIYLHYNKQLLRGVGNCYGKSDIQ